MQELTVYGAKAVLFLILLASAVGQIFVIPQLASETVSVFPEADYLRVPGIIGCVAIILCVQVALVCVWRLLSMVAESSIFEPSAFATVNLIIGSSGVATVLVAAAFVVLTVAGAMSPGVMLLLIAGVLGGTGLTLLIVVMRGLLKQATALEKDLAEVI